MGFDIFGSQGLTTSLGRISITTGSTAKAPFPEGFWRVFLRRTFRQMLRFLSVATTAASCRVKGCRLHKGLILPIAVLHTLISG